MAQVLITGCSGGIGLALAQTLAQNGFQVVATVRPGSNLQELKACCERYPALCWDYLDVLDALYHRQLIDALWDKYNGFDILICNAGILYSGAVDALDNEKILHLMQTNLSSVIALSSAFVRRMKENGQGKLIYISSLAARRPLPNLSLYNASKAGLNGFAESLYLELAPYGIEVFLVEPGWLKTKLWRRYESQTENNEKFFFFTPRPIKMEEVTFQILKICQNQANRLHRTFGWWAKIQTICKPFIYTRIGQKIYIRLLKRQK